MLKTSIGWARKEVSPVLAHIRGQFTKDGVLKHWSREYEYPWVIEQGGFQPGQWVLDAGGGGGLLQWACAGMGCHVVNIDNEPGRFSFVGQDYRVLRQRADMCRLDGFLDNSFHRVACVSVLEHVNNPGAALDELWRVLAPGGRLLVTMDVTSYQFRSVEPDQNHVLDKEGAQFLLLRFGLPLPPEPPDVLEYVHHRKDAEGKPCILKVLCLWADKP